MKLLFIRPVPFAERDRAQDVAMKENIKSMVREGTSVTIGSLRAGYRGVDYSWPRLYNSVEQVKSSYRAWKAGYDGVIVGCFHDPGLIEARSIIDIPVTGVLQSAILIASCLGNRFSVIAVDRVSGAAITERIEKYGLAGKLASIRCLSIGSQEAQEAYADPPRLVSLLTEVATKAVKEDEAEVIIPGCTILSSILTYQGVYEVDGVPIIDPVWAGIKMAEVLVDLKMAYGVGVCRASVYSPFVNWEKTIPIES